jgi:hypothetical protein
LSERLALRWSRGIGLLLVGLAAAQPCYAQDSHYWNQQYGTRAELLGGLVVGSALDISATYYNAGMLALVEDPDVVQAAQTFELQSIVLQDTPRPGEDLSSLSFRTAPSLFAGLLPSRVQGGRLAYSTLTRTRFKASLETRLGGTADVFLDEPGEETIAGERLLSQDLSELWAGLTWSRRLGGHTGFGITTYFTYFGQNRRIQSIVRAANDSTGAGGTLTVIDDFDYWTLGLLWKTGIAFDFDPWKFGLALTTPNLTYFGTGKALYNRAITGIDLDGDGNPDSKIFTGLQEGLSASHHRPWSVAAGVSYRIGRTALHFSSEYFGKVDRYTPLEANLEGEIGSLPLEKRLTQQLDHVLNLGIGVQHRFNERFAYYGAFWTDFSAAESEFEANASVTKWDIFHLSSGAKVSFRGVLFTFGVTYASGDDETPIAIDFLGDGDFVLGEPTASGATYRRLRFILGFAFTQSSR